MGQDEARGGMVEEQEEEGEGREDARCGLKLCHEGEGGTPRRRQKYRLLLRTGQK